MKSLFCGSAASSSASSEAAASSVVAASEAAAGEAAASSAASSEAASSAFSLLPAYDADPLTGEVRKSTGRMVGVMVNNIANSEKQNARPQRGIGSADLLIESKVEGGITACVPCSGMRTPSGGRAAALRP